MTPDQPSQAANTDTTPASPAPWAETFGHDLCVMSRMVGLLPQDTALCVASILGNITGSMSGLETQGGMWIPRGINLISVGREDHRSQRLFDFLLHPVLRLQDHMRDVAARSSRAITDLHTFGPGKLKDWNDAKSDPGRHRERLLAMECAVVKDLRSDGLCLGWDAPEAAMVDPTGSSVEGILRQRLPGLRHQPSFVIRPGDASQILPMMNEVAEQHAFVLDHEGRLFREAEGNPHGKGAAARRHLAEAMAERDVAITPVHADQGYGRHRRTQIRFWSALNLERAGELLADEEAPEAAIVEQAILWNPRPHVIKEFTEGLTQEVWARYKAILERIVNDRASRTGTVLPLHHARELELLDIEVAHALDQYSTPIRRHLRPFSSLVYRLYWAFCLLRWKNEEPWPLRAVKMTVLHALKEHVALIESALSQAQVQKVARTANRILKALKDKAPRTARELQRSIFNSSRADIDPALEQLVAAHLVVFRSMDRTYDLPGEESSMESCHASDRSQPLNAAGHG